MTFAEICDTIETPCVLMSRTTGLERSEESCRCDRTKERRVVWYKKIIMLEYRLYLFNPLSWSRNQSFSVCTVFSSFINASLCDCSDIRIAFTSVSAATSWFRHSASCISSCLRTLSGPLAASSASVSVRALSALLASVSCCNVSACSAAYASSSCLSSSRRSAASCRNCISSCLHARTSQLTWQSKTSQETHICIILVINAAFLSSNVFTCFWYVSSEFVPSSASL